jgi:hypothetical protein
MTDKEKDAVLDLIQKSKYLGMYTTCFINHIRNPKAYGCPDLLDSYIAYMKLEVSRRNVKLILDDKPPVPIKEETVLSWRERLRKLIKGG